MSALPNQDEADEAFLAYVAAKRRADSTLEMQDAYAAGQAWAAFINVFVGPEHKLPTSSNVIPFRSHRS